VGKICIEYDEEEGAVRADTHVELDVPILPVLQKSSKVSAEIFEDLVDLGASSVRVVLEPAEDVLESLEKEEEVEEEAGE